MICHHLDAPLGEPVKPPSTTISVEWTYTDSSDARNRTAFAMSLASPKHLNGTPANNFSARASPASCVELRPQIGVLIIPGTTEYTRMPRGASSLANECAIAFTAALLPA